MFAPLSFLSRSSSSPPSASAPANSMDSEAPSKRLNRVSSSTGYACSLRSYLRAIGRINSAAPWCVFVVTACILRGSSRLIAMIELSQLELDNDLDDDDALGNADGPQVAVPAFDRMLFRVAVAAEQLNAVQADLHAFVGAEPLGQGRLTDERQALLGARRAAPRDEPQPVQFDGDVGAHEGHRLTVGDRLTE